MTQILKLLGPEITATTANTINNATMVRALNSGSGVSLITLAYANTTTYATMTVAGYSETIIRKKPTDTIQGTDIKAIQVA